MSALSGAFKSPDLDPRAQRIQVTAEQRRLDAAAQLEVERGRLALDRQRQIAQANARQERQHARRQHRAALARRINTAAPAIGRKVLIGGPILAPMTVAWIGQIQFAQGTLSWPLYAAVVFAAAWELTTAFSGWMYHQARQDGDRGSLFRAATWLFAASAGGMNYWHALDGAPITHPTPKAVSYGAMSLVGIALWELYASLIHRKQLRDRGALPPARPRFGVARWVRYPGITFTAWSLAIRDGLATTEDAWKAARASAPGQGRTQFGSETATVEVTAQATDPVAAQATSEPLAQTTPEPLTQGTPQAPYEVTFQGITQATTQVTPEPLTQVTGQATREVTPQVTSEATRQAMTRATRKPRGKAATKSRRTDEELIAELDIIVADHYREHPGEEINVKPVAAKLGIGRDRARRLLDQMNVRPIRREATG